MKRREELDKYHELSEEELQAEAARLKESLFRLKFKLALGEVDAVKRIRQEKRSLARHTNTDAATTTAGRLRNGAFESRRQRRNHGPPVCASR